MYMINKHGPKTEPCGTEQNRRTVNEVPLRRTTLKDLSNREE